MEHYQIREVKMKYKNYKKVKTIQFTEAGQIYEWFKTLQNEAQEKFVSIYLNTRNEVIAFSVDFIGGINACVVDPKIIFKNALLLGAPALILVHNHPSGMTDFSTDDIDIKTKIKAGGKMLDIELIDSIVIGYKSYKSMKEEGLI